MRHAFSRFLAPAIVLLGLVVATHSVTGVVIWMKKRKARAHRRRRTVRSPAPVVTSPLPAE